ncbi:MAG: oxaloacetate decarboxylase subunit alpha, partial [Eubacterium sp.]|nr:oxaloacetate decarboxylase subunit alpha [Eubacterium sp.]
MMPKESKGILRGEYGRLPGEVSEEARAKAGIKPEDIITCRYADLIEPEMDKLREQYKDIAESDEDILNLALFPQVAPGFIENRRKAREAAKAAAAPAAAVPAQDGSDTVRELYVEFKQS